ncbi:MAG: 4-hydroxy-tetrahydrodipicolinate synthase [Cyclobacteriaceae bacterium]
MSIDRLAGTGVALVTPFKKDLTIDFDALERVIDHVSQGQAEYLVILGTTGESATIAPEERFQILDFVVEKNKANLPLVLGYGSNNTQTLKTALKQFKDYPLDAILSVSPYYNRPSQKGIEKHYLDVADASPFPLIVYNVPPRTGSNISADTTITLSKHENIIGTKEAAGDLTQVAEILSGTDEDFLVISGEDSLTLPMISMGAKGAISVIANLQPKPFSEMVRLALKGDFKEASKIHFSLLKCYGLVSAEGNPVSVKTGMEAAGLILKDVRQPLFEGSEELLGSFKQYL